MGGKNSMDAGMNATPYGKYVPSNFSHWINLPSAKRTGEPETNHGQMAKTSVANSDIVPKNVSIIAVLVAHFG